MDITYEDIYNGSAMDIYKEDTNVLAYYIIKMILIYNYKDFLYWCKKNNNNLLYFKKTEQNKYSFLNFIKKKYKNKEMLKDINNMKYFIDNLNIKNNFILYNLRMTLLET
jgi:hypothetical protein